MPEAFPSSGIGKVDLDERKADTHQGVAKRDARMGQSTRVDQEAVNATDRPADEIEDRSLVVRLERLQLQPQLLTEIFEASLDLTEGDPSVYFGLPLSEQLKVGAVYERAAHGSRVSPPRPRG